MRSSFLGGPPPDGHGQLNTKYAFNLLPSGLTLSFPSHAPRLSRWWGQSGRTMAQELNGNGSPAKFFTCEVNDNELPRFRESQHPFLWAQPLRSPKQSHILTPHAASEPHSRCSPGKRRTCDATKIRYCLRLISR